MAKHTHSLAKLVCTISICFTLSSCASFGAKTKKAPCGPTAGMTDPCGNRIPINNGQDHFKSLKDEKTIKTTQV